MVDLWNFVVQNQQEILRQTGEHIALTFIALIIAVFIGVPLGIVLTRYQKSSGTVLGIVGVIQTIPSLALLGFLLPLLGIGATPAVVALFLYALLPIVRNTYAGIDEVDESVVEAARGMGMSNLQRLAKVELPLGIPVIFAGIRTATVINVGVATLCALIGAGGLGEYIFRGIALNNVNMILAGAIPAAMLALSFDFVLGMIQKYIRKIIKPLLAVTGLILLVVIPWSLKSLLPGRTFKAGMPPEFIERPDGYRGLKKYYNFDIPTVEMDAALMYRALRNGRVDVIGGYSTDGRIKAFNLRVLKDDKNYFPPYSCAPLVSESALQEYPQLKKVLNKLSGKISNDEMVEMNYQVDQNHRNPGDVARDFLQKKGFKTGVSRSGTPDVIIGGKNFTEHFILGHMFAILIENYTNLDAGLKLGLAGTQIVFNALLNHEIDLYPEYTGTGLHVLLKADSTTVNHLGNSKQKVYDYVSKFSRKKFNIEWLRPLGFDNTYALMMREEQAEKLHIRTISDMVRYIHQHE